MVYDIYIYIHHQIAPMFANTTKKLACTKNWTIFNYSCVFWTCPFWRKRWIEEYLWTLDFGPVNLYIYMSIFKNQLHLGILERWNAPFCCVQWFALWWERQKKTASCLQQENFDSRTIWDDWMPCILTIKDCAKWTYYNSTWEIHFVLSAFGILSTKNKNKTSSTIVA